MYNICSPCITYVQHMLSICTTYVVHIFNICSPYKHHEIPCSYRIPWRKLKYQKSTSTKWVWNHSHLEFDGTDRFLICTMSYATHTNYICFYVDHMSDICFFTVMEYIFCEYVRFLPQIAQYSIPYVQHT